MNAYYLYLYPLQGLYFLLVQLNIAEKLGSVGYSIV
jgi:hypothetical protein